MLRRAGPRGGSTTRGLRARARSSAWAHFYVSGRRYPASMTSTVMPFSTPAELAAVIGRPPQQTLAAMLYGSYARGSHEAGSDVDVLELVPDSPTPYSIGEVNVTQYAPAHLHEMAQRGSLFVLHLLTDGVTILDPSGVLERALAHYRPPESYKPIWNQLSVVAGAVNPDAPDADRFAYGLCRLALYSLRTAVYLHAIEDGAPCFDVDVAAERLGVPGLVDTLKWRRRADFTLADLSVLSDLLTLVLPFRASTQPRSTSSYAVAHSDSPDLAALFAAVLGEGEIEYSALTVPPF